MMSSTVCVLVLIDKLLSLHHTMLIHSRVVLRGERDDNAVLCTKDTTFELKVAETSNTLLLMPSLNDPTKPGDLVCK